MPVTVNGRIALELLSDKAKARLVSMMNDPAVQALGVKPAASDTSSSASIDPMLTGALYDALGSLAASIAVATGHTVDSAKLMHFTAEEKQALAEPTAAVLNKYSGAWSKYEAEIALGLLLVTFGQAKVAQLVKRPADVRKFPAAAPDLAPTTEPQS